MSKQISNGELAEIVTGLLVGRLGPEQLDSTERYASFMTDLARLVCDHCGGAVSDMAADNSCEQWLIGISANDSLPSDGGVWGAFDPEGEWEEGNPAQVAGHKPTAVVWLDGGVVQWVASDIPMQYLVLDADIEGCVGSEKMEITMENGESAEVAQTPSTSLSDCLPAWVAQVVNEVESKL